VRRIADIDRRILSAGLADEAILPVAARAAE